jgi:hypothetical protein
MYTKFAQIEIQELKNKLNKIFLFEISKVWKKCETSIYVYSKQQSLIAVQIKHWKRRRSFFCFFSTFSTLNLIFDIINILRVLVTHSCYQIFFRFFFCFWFFLNEFFYLEILEPFVFLTQLWLYFKKLRKTAKTSII